MNMKRVLVRDAILIALLSAVMAAILAFAWDGVYSQATALEETVLGTIPGESEEGGIQAAGMFGLGLYLTWAVLFAQDVRRRLQGYLIVGGSLLALAVLAVFNTFLPQVGWTLQNLAAFLVGVIIAVSTELFESPLNSGRASLKEASLKESSLRGLLDENGKELPFSAATRGLLALLAIVLGGGVVALIISGASILLIGLAFVVTALFVWRLKLFLTYENSLDIEILGPTQSGKTLFLYGIYLTITESDSFRYYESKPEWKGKIGEIEARQNTGQSPWGAVSTEVSEIEEYWMEFVDTDGYWKKVEISLTDFPGGWLYRLFRREDQNKETETETDEQAVASDGGTPVEDENSGHVTSDGGGESTERDGEADEAESEWNVSDDSDRDVFKAFPYGLARPLETENINTIQDVKETSEEELAEILGDEATAAEIKAEVGTTVSPETDGQQPEQPEQEPEPADSDDSPVVKVRQDDEQVASDEIEELYEGIEKSLLDSDTIICVIDMRAAVDLGHVTLSDHNVRGEDDTQDGSADELALDQMTDICENIVEPEEIVYVATKSDLLLDEYPGQPPHKELGDIDDFTDWVNQKLDKPPFNVLLGETANKRIYPVYYQTAERDDGDVVPVLDDGVMQPEGFEQLLKELAPE